MFTSKLFRYLTESDFRFETSGIHGLNRYISDEEYLKRLFKIKVGYDLNLKNPRSFNEKLQWLKLYDRNPIYTTLVDKYAVKDYVARIIGEEHIIPTIGVWNHFDEIDFDILPQSFVLKCTHDSGGIVICKDKDTFDRTAARKKLERNLKRNFYWMGREWPYKNVKPRIIAEPYMTDESNTELKDYKIFNFSGEQKIIQVDYDRFSAHKRNLYSADWEFIDTQIQFPNDPNRTINEPENIEQMFTFAKALSKGFPHVRTDFYLINNMVYFGEMTFYHGSGFETFRPASFGNVMGDWLHLPGVDI